jgi:UDP-N-acetylmuramoyl-L-alanyl-D-glutamate--2,6-diaminopimelate ligase
MMARSEALDSTPRWRLADLLAAAHVQPDGTSFDSDLSVNSITDDSRRVKPGGCFVAVRGLAVDGHRYVHAAAEAGAVVVVADEPVSVPAGVTLLRVADSREAVARLAAVFYGVQPGGARALTLVGVTGTNGKTTVAWLTRSILQAAGHKCALFGTIEYDLIDKRLRAALTTPGPIELAADLAHAARAGATHAVLEVSSHALDQRRTDGLAFAAGVFTNLSGDHLDYHETMDAYLAAKRRLFEALPPDGLALINADDPRAAEVRAGCSAGVLPYGIEASEGVALRAEIEELGPRYSRFVLRGAIPDRLVTTRLVGRHNVENALAAAAAAVGLGVEADAIVAGLEGLAGVPGRLERVEPDGCPFSVYVDYAHTDDALRHALGVLRALTPGRLICVFGCGGDRDRSKRPRMAAAVQEHADVAVVTSDNPRTEEPREIIAEILPGFTSDAGCEVEVEPDRLAAISMAIDLAEDQDAVLIAGKGHEDYQLIGGRVLPFDDREVARACLRLRERARAGKSSALL